MNIKKYASVPKLVEIILDNEELVERYEEPITFYSYDVVPMTTYFEFFNARSNNEFVQLDKMMKNMILDKDGKRVLADNEDLPIDIAAAAINKLGEILGKSLSKTSTQKVGELAK
jgi:hypothetical protein